MSEETETQEEQTQGDTEAQQAPSGPPEGYLSQDEVNAIVAREVAKAKRAAKRDTKQAKDQTPEPSGDQIGQLTGQVSALSDAVASLINGQKAQEQARAFEADTQGLEIPGTDLAVLKTLHSHAPELYQSKLAELRKRDLPPDPKGQQSFGGSGAGTSPAPREPDMGDPTTWTKDDIAAMKKAGTFSENLRKARNSMPGGRGGLFPSKY